MPVRSRSRVSRAIRNSPQCRRSSAARRARRRSRRRSRRRRVLAPRAPARSRACEQCRPLRDRPPDRRRAGAASGASLPASVERRSRQREQACRAGRRDRAAVPKRARCAPQCARRRRCAQARAVNARRARGSSRHATIAACRAARASCAAQRMREPVAKQPAARRRRARVEQRQQRRRGLAAQRLGDFEIAARRGIERQEFARRSTPSARMCASADCCVAAA